MKPRVAFLCTHNACRSQMAEAISRLYAGDAFVAYSAGTKDESRINPDAVRVIKSIYNIDMEGEQQYPKRLNALPEDIDILVTIGSNLDTSHTVATHREDWDIPDPKGRSDMEFRRVAQIIEEKVIDLKNRIVCGVIRL